MAYNPPRRQRFANLRERVRLEELTLIDGPFNPIEVWEPRGVEPCRVEPMKGSEQWGGDEMIARQAYRVFIRFRADLISTASWRVVWLRGGDDEQVLNIEASTNPDERRRYLELLCDVPPGAQP